MSARGETLSLFRTFLRLRHAFPNKQGRSILRRWTHMYFTMRQADYHRIALRKGRSAADSQAAVWRRDARDDLELWQGIAAQGEASRRRLLHKIIQYEAK